jgi:hypothetical protein
MAFKTFTGRMTLLRVHDVGTKFGPKSDQIDVEVVFKLDVYPDNAFGFTLRDDDNGPAHRGMLALLCSGFEHNWKVATDAEVPDGKRNGVSTRVWLTK